MDEDSLFGFPPLGSRTVEASADELHAGRKAEAARKAEADQRQAEWEAHPDRKAEAAREQADFDILRKAEASGYRAVISAALLIEASRETVDALQGTGWRLVGFSLCDCCLTITGRGRSIEFGMDQISQILLNLPLLIEGGTEETKTRSSAGVSL